MRIAEAGPESTTPFSWTACHDQSLEKIASLGGAPGVGANC